ncbi:MAG: hypothetical protein ACI4IM_11415 [Acutalibacteraceae bacterium]
MKEHIKLPSYEWFLGLMAFGGDGNIYAGSYGTDPYKGCLVSDTFRYRVWIEKDENNEKLLKAVYYVGTKCYDETEKDKMTEMTFEASAEGINEAQKFLLEKLDEFIDEYKGE